jgi:predicted methyltransferase
LPNAEVRTDHSAVVQANPSGRSVANDWPSGEESVLIDFIAQFREENVKEPIAFFVTVAAAMLLSHATPALTAEAVTTAPTPVASVPANIVGAIVDTNRPQADVDLDARRKPAEMLTFAGVKPGDRVLEFVPGRGYVTRLMAKAVGATGHVYAANLPTFNEALKTGLDPIIASPAYGNVSKIEQPFGEIRVSEPLNVVWISENYHDFKNMGMFSTDTNAMNRAVFAALKPEGTYVITDYVAAAGSGTRDTQSLHRIDPEVIKREVIAAGFMLEAESTALMNPSDDLAVRSRQGASQVMLRFRKPH